MTGRANAPAPLQPPSASREAPLNVLILGGGFGGVYTAMHLARQGRQFRNLQITLVSRDNYFLMTPLLFEAGSGILEPRHVVNPIRPLLRGLAQFVEGEVEHVDFERRIVTARHASGFEPFELPYDHLVIALGGVTNRSIIPGSQHAMTFKTLADAIFVRNHIIDLFEQADIEPDPQRRRMLLTIVVVGAGLVGVELIGELTDFVRTLRRSYPRVSKDDIRFHLIEAGPKVLPELERDLAEHAVEALRNRGVDIRTGTPVRAIEPGVLHLPGGQTLTAATIVLATGVAPAPLLKSLAIEKDRRGRVAVDATMRAAGKTNVWALGDCAAIPDPNGNPYPPLAQHALRQARVLAGNICTVLSGSGKLERFEYKSLGTLAALGHFDGVGRVLKVKLRGFPAWWVWRSYYLMQMPRWERRLRIMLDWTVALLFKNDVVKLDLFGHEHPLRQLHAPKPQASAARDSTQMG
jgi:NADH dehydrogenase